MTRNKSLLSKSVFSYLMFKEMRYDGSKFILIHLFTPHRSLTLASRGQYIVVNSILFVKPLADV